MGIFTRFRDIVSSNINAMLDRAEDPEKLVKLMIQEMEDTLVELKAACARSMASRTRVNRALEDAKGRADSWGAKALLAIEKGREDLAREALVEKRNYQEQVAGFEREAVRYADLIENYQTDIQQLEEKLQTTRDRHQLLVQRQIHAHKNRQTPPGLRPPGPEDPLVRFDKFGARVERREPEPPPPVAVPRKPTLEEEFRKLEMDEEVERDLQTMKQQVAARPKPRVNP